MDVKVWTEKISIPTYEVGEAEKNPMFFEKRVYQGSSGVVYPNPIIEKIYDQKIDKEYQGVFLENKYLKIMILPELGGRVQMAYDKIKERHFIYYNQVIKPALVGLCGPWISGGIEFNWPQHHRPSTFEPVAFTIENNHDGSKTIWVNEIEKMFHTKGMAGFTLYEDKAYLEIKAKLNNRTSSPQTFLWWANPAVKVHDHYQSIFPPDVNAVFDHGKRDVSSFPIATGTYYKVDYSPGTDISKYKNVPVPTSYMAVNSKYNFLGGYEHDIQAGMLHVADHHISPGKKQWTWGNGDFGLAWDRNLTDEDGPYIELMAGVYTDNQPDFTWLKPFEEKTFTQYFLPYRELDSVKNASKDLLLNVETKSNELHLQLFATSNQELNIRVFIEEESVWEKNVRISPESIYKEKVSISENVDGSKFKIFIFNEHKKEVLNYDPSINQRDEELPSAAKPALLPHEIDSTEQLFLTGQHLEQYRHATYRPLPYYLEAVKREPTDVRNNNAIGLWYFKKGLFLESESYFRRAIITITERNPNPYDCEPYYNLGLSLLFQNKTDEAYENFFKAAWDKSLQDASYFYIAQIDFLKGNYDLCLEHIDWALDRNARNGKAYLVKICALKELGLKNEVLKVIEQSLEKDNFNLSVLYEKYLFFTNAGDLEKAKEIENQLFAKSGQTAHNAIEYGIDYIMLGQYKKAVEWMIFSAAKQLDTPLLNYYLGYSYLKNNEKDLALYYFKSATEADPAYCFPNRLEDILVLNTALEINKEDNKALYYLGLLYYDKQQYDLAINLWERAIKLDQKFPTVFRNLGLAYYNKKQDQEKALLNYEKAFSLDTKDSRILMELDSLYKKLNKSASYRLDFLNKHLFVALERDDLYLEIVALNNFLGNHQEAFEKLMSHKFHPWEGGEGKVSEQYIISLIELSKNHYKAGNYKVAINLLENAQLYPENLGEGKLVGAQENDIFYWLGCNYYRLGDHQKSVEFLEKATQGSDEPGIALFYNDQQPDKIFYQGCAWSKLGQKAKADSIFKKLVSYGEQNIHNEIVVDYFAVSLPDLLIFESDLNMRNIIHCLYISALGYLGLGSYEKSKQLFEQVLAKEATHFGAQTHLKMLNDFEMDTHKIISMN